jgi:RNase adaptor protein for sRNA GlmZ degradation
MKAYEMAKNVESVLKRLDHEYERVKIGFLDAETPRLLALLDETRSTIRTLSKELKAEEKRLKHLKRYHKTLQEQGSKPDETSSK